MNADTAPLLTPDHPAHGAFDFDLFVIGGGSGGVRAGRIAAGEHGARVGMAEQSRMGGTCVIRGCVPKKLMIFAASAPEAAAEARAYGWQGAEAGHLDWPAFRGHLHAELNRLEQIYERGFTSAGGSLFKSRATVTGPHTVRLADWQSFSAKHILIAAGGRPVRPDIPGAELGLISDDLFDLEQLPQRVLIVGGGYIAVEFATILAGFGSSVTVVHRGDRLLRGFDGQMRDCVASQLEGQGVTLRLNSGVERIEAEAGDGSGTRKVSFTEGGEDRFDAVFFAIGREPYTEGLGLAEAGVELGARGEVLVDRYSQTAVPSIYAVGDVTDRVNLTPVAIREGHAFADTLFGSQARFVDHDIVASAVFTRPFEVGSVGMTEEEAARHGPVEVYAADFTPMRRAFAGLPGRVVMKLIVAAESRKVLGCHIFGPEAGEMIQLVAIPITMGASKADFDATIAVHPTLAEELVTLRLPVRRHGEVPAEVVAAAAGG